MTNRERIQMIIGRWGIKLGESQEICEDPVSNTIEVILDDLREILEMFPKDDREEK